MIVIRLMGGLGNQMFQYAMGRKLSLKWKQELYFDDSAFEQDGERNYALGMYNVKMIRAPQMQLSKYHKIRTIIFRIRKYVNITRLAGFQLEKGEFAFESYRQAKYYEGYWQNERNFDSIKEVLQGELVYTGKLTEIQKRIISQMQQENSVAVHVRRGDYLSEKNRDTYVCVPIEYYQRAIAYMQDKMGQISLYVFSDDIAWCRQNFASYENITYVDDAISDNANIDCEMMRNCRHFIIGNSTFSWWPAWLAKSEDKIVIAPKRWFVNEEDNRAVEKGLCRHLLRM